MGRNDGGLPRGRARSLLTLFVAGATARTAADLLGVHRNTAARFYTRVRQAIAAAQGRRMAEAFGGPVAVDGRDLAARPRKRRRGPRPAEEVAVVVIFCHGGRVYAQMAA